VDDVLAAGGGAGVHRGGLLGEVVDVAAVQGGRT
jgi:hypothetical protein